jgi:hypothetical protein
MNHHAIGLYGDLDMLSRWIGVGVRPEHVRIPLMSNPRDDR